MMGTISTGTHGDEEKEFWTEETTGAKAPIGDHHWSSAAGLGEEFGELVGVRT